MTLPNGNSAGRSVTSETKTSAASNALLSGKEEHYLKRELISQQVQFEIAELNSPTALQRFGAPFRSPLGEVAPVDSELPILRYIFVHHVRNFPFLDQAKEKEFWQDRLQVFLESFANKRISSSEDRLEETKRRKLALKASKLVELMMNSGIGTTSGYEERVTFNEIEVVDRNADEAGLLMNVPEGNSINGWDVNICAVRKTSIKRHVRYHTHAEYLIRSKRTGKPDVVVARRFNDFLDLHSTLRGELPGKVLPTIPRKVKDSEEADPEITETVDREKDDAESVSSESSSSSSGLSYSTGNSVSMPGAFSDGVNEKPTKKSKEKASVTTRLYKETQRITLRAFIRALLQDKQTANSKALREFLTDNPVTLGDEEKVDENRRKAMDELRITEQRKFFEAARQRARELDIYMEGFRRDIVEDGGLTKLFAEIRKADRLSDLSTRYRKFAEWLRIEVAATIYHIFLAEDNSPELFTQMKRIHSLLPYTAIKHIIRLANPAAVMSSILDLFLATPFGARSLMERVISLSLQDSIKQLQKTLDALEKRIDDPAICAKIKDFVNSPEEVKDYIRLEATTDSVDLIVAIIKSDRLLPEPTNEQIERIFNAYVAWNCAVESVDDSLKAGAQLFVCLKQYLRFTTRERDKNMLQAIISEPVTLQLFRDLFTIFYDPLIRVYKSANVYNSISDFAVFMDDMIKVIEKCQRQSMSHDPNQTVQAFIDLCARHEDNFYKFVHEVHIHDNGLFDSLMGWLEGILHFLRTGPSSGAKLDMNGLLEEGVKQGIVERDVIKKEVDDLIAWQLARKRWHEAKTRQKMAGGDDWSKTIPDNVFSGADFGLEQGDLEDLNDLEEEMDEDEEEETDDPIEVERRRRHRKDILRARSGEPVKPTTENISKLMPIFLSRLRQVLAE